MLKKILVSTLICWSTVNVTFASELSEKNAVVRIMNNYVSSIACSENKVQLKDVFTVQKPSESGSIYFVLWNGDVGCEGGTATHSYYISEVSNFSPSRPLLVKSNDAFGDNNEEHLNSNKASINYRFIQSIKQIDPYEFEIISYAYADEKYGGKDAGNMGPANKFQYNMVFFEDEGWKITKQVLLEQNN